LPEGIKKDITRHPPALKYMPPQLGDEVEMHCVGSLKRGGRQFFSTRDAGEVLKYKVGHSDLIHNWHCPGWDLALQNMRKGEHAKFTIEPEFAYKDHGAGDPDSADHVPPGSTIVLELELVKCPMREDLFEDGGVIKREVKDGPGGRQPRSGDECQITYKVIVDEAEVVMASRHAVYKLGSQQLGTMGKAIDKALMTMKRGDEASLTCQPNYGFAEGSYAGKVAMVTLTLEQIYEVHDMSLGEKDATVLRKRIKEGDGNDRVHDTAKVQMRVSSASANGERILREQKEFSFLAGNGDVCDALEGSVLGMKEGEEAILRCESSEAVAGGLLGLRDGLETPIMIHIVVVSFDKVLEKWDLDGPGRIARGRARKEVATDLYKRGRIRLACHHFDLIADLFVALDFFKADDQNDAAELRRLARLNKAMCMLKLGNVKTVKELCTLVLKEDSANPKALFRRAKALVALREYPEAITDLQRLLEVEPGSGDGKALLREAKRLLKSNDEHQSRTFAKMCAGLGQMPERSDRREDDVVVMPNLEQEYAKIAQKHGLPMPRKAPPKAEATEPAHAETAHAEPVDAEPAHAEPSHAEPAHAEPAHAEPAQAEPAHAEQ